MSGSPTRRALVRLGQSVAVPLALALLWELLARRHWINPQALPPPSQILHRWWEGLRPAEPFDPARGGYLRWLFSGEMPGDMLASLTRVLVGFGIGTALAIPLGLLLGTSRIAYRLGHPLLEILRPIPPIAYVPLAIVWFGLGNPPAFFLISLGAFFPVLVSTIAGVRNVDSIYLRAARNLGAGGTTLFTRVILPAAAPQILTGTRVGLGVAFIVVIVAEMIAVNSGLGYRILEAREFFWSDKIIAGMFTIGLLGLGLDTAMELLNGHLLRWHRSLESH
jgi:NitT/TauT family transport system permease protein